MTQLPFVPDFQGFHRSISEELQAVKNRIRNLARHWATDGEHKEVALRSVLRRHLPESLFVARGFIVNQQKCSSQIDVLIVDRSVPTLFKDGDLVIVTPDAVRAIIEVKTRLTGEQEVSSAAEKVADNALICDGRANMRPWTGLFDFDTEGIDHRMLLRSLSHVWRTKQEYPIDCISLGSRHFVRYWRNALLDQAMLGAGRGRAAGWRSYDLDGLAPSYFLGNLIEYLSPRGHLRHPGYAWFPLENGKEPFVQWDISVGSDVPVDARQPNQP